MVMDDRKLLVTDDRFMFVLDHIGDGHVQILSSSKSAEMGEVIPGISRGSFCGRHWKTAFYHPGVIRSAAESRSSRSQYWGFRRHHRLPDDWDGLGGPWAGSDRDRSAVPGTASWGRCDVTKPYDRISMNTSGTQIWLENLLFVC